MLTVVAFKGWSDQNLWRDLHQCALKLSKWTFQCPFWVDFMSKVLKHRSSSAILWPYCSFIAQTQQSSKSCRLCLGTLALAHWLCHERPGPISTCSNDGPQAGLDGGLCRSLRISYHLSGKFLFLCRPCHSYSTALAAPASYFRST